MNWKLWRRARARGHALSKTNGDIQFHFKPGSTLQMALSREDTLEFFYTLGAAMFPDGGRVDKGQIKRSLSQGLDDRARMRASKTHKEQIEITMELLLELLPDHLEARVLMRDAKAMMIANPMT